MIRRERKKITRAEPYRRRHAKGRTPSKGHTMKKKNGRIKKMHQRARKKGPRWWGVIWLAFGVELAKRVAGTIVDWLR
jgi:hypothetical protein